MPTLVILLFTFWSSLSFAFYSFADPAQEQRYQNLLVELRCVVCENQSLADSNAPLAEDLRLEIYQQMMQGKNDEQIKDFLVQRYGVHVLYDPPLQTNTWVLWLGPVLLFIVGIFIWGYRIYGRNIS